MSVSRLFAAIVSLVVGALTLVVVAALYLSDAIVDTGFGRISAADAALLDDIVAVLPVVAVFGAVISAGGVGLLVGARFARAAVAVASFAAFVASLAGVIALSLGNDPFVGHGHGQTADGIGILLSAAIVNLAILAGVAFDRPSEGVASRRAV